MADTAASFANLVPGFDFLQGLVKNAGASLPGIGQWVAPTLDPAELEKRIEELRTVQFWLEQNAKMLGATIQALEVQRMTLSALKTMNVQMDDLRESMKIRLPAQEEAAPAEPPAAKKAAAKAAAPAPAGVVDPMQWWGALTKQFSELAAGALKEGAAEVGRVSAGVNASAPSSTRPAPAAAPEATPAPAAPKRARKRAARSG
jgi:hypothetical protein